MRKQQAKLALSCYFSRRISNANVQKIAAATTTRGTNRRPIKSSAPALGQPQPDPDTFIPPLLKTRVNWGEGREPVQRRAVPAGGAAAPRSRPSPDTESDPSDTQTDTTQTNQTPPKQTNKQTKANQNQTNKQNTKQTKTKQKKSKERLTKERCFYKAEDLAPGPSGGGKDWKTSDYESLM